MVDYENLNRQLADKLAHTLDINSPGNIISIAPKNYTTIKRPFHTFLHSTEHYDSHSSNVFSRSHTDTEGI